MTQYQIRQAVLIGSEIAASVATALILVRMFGGPDAMRTLKMKAAKSVEQTCMDNAKFWANLALVAEKTYDNGRLATL